MTTIALMGSRFVDEMLRLGAVPAGRALLGALAGGTAAATLALLTRRPSVPAGLPAPRPRR